MADAVPGSLVATSTTTGVHDELRQLLMNTIVWVAGGEVPEGGAPGRPLTEDELNANFDDYSN